MTELDRTHDARASSWLASANTRADAGGPLVGAADFPIQNLPYASFRRAGSSEPYRCGVAVGDQIVDLAALSRAQVPGAPSGAILNGLAAEACRAAAQPQLNELFELGANAWQALRWALFDALHSDVAPAIRERVGACLVAQSQAEYQVPVRIGDYTDFYTSLDHAANIGRLFRPDAPVSPNFHWMPIAYHGRVSSIGVSGQSVRRPMGQFLPDGASEPIFAACRKLDYELELGVLIGRGNDAGESIAVADAADHVFGMCLLNDWSARDVQRWESQPLGPFLAKNFATTLSPWVVTRAALLPYQQPWSVPADAPAPLPYLDDAKVRAAGALDIQLEVWLESQRQRSAGGAPQRMSATRFGHQYWTIAQMIAQHTAGGCNLRPGDLIGTGTISGPTAGEAGALIELTRNGQPLIDLGDGETRGFLEDGDAVTLRGWCEKPGFARVGFGSSRAVVSPARD